MSVCAAAGQPGGEDWRPPWPLGVVGGKKPTGGEALQAPAIGEGLCVRVGATAPLHAPRSSLGAYPAGRVLTLFFSVLAGLAFVRPCLASQLLTVGASAADVALSGATVGEPKTPAGAMFSNPAGLVLFDETTADFSAGISFAKTGVDASAPPAYEDENSFLVLSPGFGVAVPRKGRWHYGLAAYGSVGTKFDFEADPAAGVDHSFLSEAGIFTLAPGLAYRISDRLSVGGAINPLFGLLKMRFTQQDIPFKYKLTGPGIQGMFGLRWEPRDGLALGVGVRTPGRVWMDGTMPVGGSQQDVDLELEMPAQIFSGITTRMGERATVSVAFRWTDSSSFGDSPIEFELMPDVSLPFVPAAEDEYAVSVGVEYAWSELLDLRLSGVHSNAIVGTEGISPLIFDTEDYRLGAGFGLNFDHWSLDFMAGHAFEGTRDVAANEAAVLPGTYSVEGHILMIAATWRR